MTSRTTTRIRLAIPTRNKPWEASMSFAVWAASPGVSSPSTTMTFPKIARSDISSRAAPAVRLALRIDQ
jgi:hypothetical protein